MGSQSVTLGTLTPTANWGSYNNIAFIIRQAISKLNTATLVRVESCTNDGGVSPFGLVDITPLVNQVDGSGISVPYVKIYGLPYLRIQGGANAIIIDPQPGDIGVAIFASRDISKVKSTQAQALPGSARQYDLSDGMYLGGLLNNAAPTQYLQFNSSGITVLSPTAVTLTAPAVQMGASGGTTQTLVLNAFFEWFQSQIFPFLQSMGYPGAAAPSNSVSTATEAS